MQYKPKIDKVFHQISDILVSSQVSTINMREEEVVLQYQNQFKFEE